MSDFRTAELGSVKMDVYSPLFGQEPASEVDASNSIDGHPMMDVRV
jgi:hypothetical protein